MKQAIIALTILMLTVAAQPGIAQTVHQLPFASSNNSLELTVVNTSSTALAGVRITVTNLPSWLAFSSTEEQLVLMKSGSEAVVRFSFSVDKSAPINKAHTISFTITATSPYQWSKEIAVTVAPPDRADLFQNYPNPFNPSTTISYLLPSDGRVSLNIYNLLGQQIAVLAGEDEKAGYHHVVFDASRFSSGMYVYRFTFVDQSGKRFSSQKRMLLVK